MPTFIVEKRTGGAWLPGVDTRDQPLWEEHAAFIDDLFEQGSIVLAGPLADGAGAAVLVFEAESEAAIRDVLAADPWAEHDLLHVERIREWRLFLDARTREG
jgi:uncharacterized protein YciI